MCLRSEGKHGEHSSFESVNQVFELESSLWVHSRTLKVDVTLKDRRGSSGLKEVSWPGAARLKGPLIS